MTKLERKIYKRLWDRRDRRKNPEKYRVYQERYTKKNPHLMAMYNHLMYLAEPERIKKSQKKFQKRYYKTKRGQQVLKTSKAAYHQRHHLARLMHNKLKALMIKDKRWAFQPEGRPKLVVK